jgi:hydroxymethylbilane synthase
MESASKKVRSLMSPKMPLRIGTRGSPLALAQANQTRDLLCAAHGLAPEAIEICIIKTTGDAILDRPLSEAGGKGLFTKELDTALIAGEIDIAVHSAKDLPTLLPDAIEVAGYLPREDVRDVWISPVAAHPRDLPQGATVGTASLRRGAMLKRLRPDLEIVLFRGNVQTRLRKLAEGECAGTLLALAGLRRLGLADRATSILPVEEFLPAAGQGAIGITARAGDEAAAAVLAPVLCHATGVALAAERAFLGALDGSCRTPIGAHAVTEGTHLRLHGIVLRADGSEVFEEFVAGEAADAAVLGDAAGKAIRARLPNGFFGH